MSVRREIAGEEIAYRTLNREKVKFPCILASWCMKRDFFRHYSGKNDIYKNAPETVVKAFIKAGANLCPQFIMPSSDKEHLAANPFSIGKSGNHNQTDTYNTPEDVKDYIENLPLIETLSRDFNLEEEADNYAEYLMNLDDIAEGEMLFISGFGQADFMGGYNRWGYDNYLMAFSLYSEHIKQYYDYTGEKGRLRNLAIVRAIEKYNLAPFVYGGQDICFNDGPIVSVEKLNELYFPALKRAVKPLHEAGIRIIWHCDGDVRPITNILLKDIGVAGFQGFQEETGCTLEEMSSLQTKEGEKPIIWGSVSVTTTLPYGSVADVKKDVERCFQTVGKKGFALASTSSILPETPLENIIALYKHGQEYGKEFLN